jgi:hypothetical protein
MEKIKLSAETVLKLQYSIVAAAVYPYYLEKNKKDNIEDEEKAADEAHYAAIVLISKLNADIVNYVDTYELDK